MNELNNDDNNLSYLDYDEYELFSEDAEWSPVVMRAMMARWPTVAVSVERLYNFADINNIYILNN
jgi:hypothetical protein